MGKNCNLDMNGLQEMIDSIRSAAEKEGAKDAAACVEPVVKGLYTYVANLVDSDYEPDVIAMTMLNLGMSLSVQSMGFRDTMVAVITLLHTMKRSFVNPLAEPEAEAVHG